MVQLYNDHLTVSISEKGAELQSIRLHGEEYLWQANPAHWGKHAPVLFPVIGELKGGIYTYRQRNYTLARHGFAREKLFGTENVSATAASFNLHSDADTLEVYPFPFLFRVEYSLNEATLYCTYHVENTGNDDMYFSVGGHPAFRVPLANGLQYTDYALRFDNDTSLTRHLLQKGLVTDKTEQLSLTNSTLPLQQSLFYTDAIVLKHIKSKEITLYSEKDAHGLTFRFEGFPYFGIWAAVDAPFVCLEPWCGIADSVHHNQQLEQKEGINKLAAGGVFRRTWSVGFF